MSEDAHTTVSIESMVLDVLKHDPKGPPNQGIRKADKPTRGNRLRRLFCQALIVLAAAVLPSGLVWLGGWELPTRRSPELLLLFVVTVLVLNVVIVVLCMNNATREESENEYYNRP